MSEERKVKINGIPISNAGFTNLQFETSKSSNSVNTIRGFGSLFKEENLNIIQTISIDFDLKVNELKNLAYIYTLFKACGILPIENEYLLNKVGSTYTQSKNKKQLEKDDFSKSNISHLVCLLERMNINSLEKTSDGYKVNLILTLYDSALTKNEFEEYINQLTQDSNYIDFEKKCKSIIASEISKLSSRDTSSVSLDIYNAEKLNSVYKEHLINSVLTNNKLNQDSEIKNEEKANEIRDKVLSSINNYAPTNILIDNKHILQIEFITHNKISNLPLLGSPIFAKSYLGIGESFFNIKCVFKEEENDIVNQLKAISDKNIINHKIELKHPLVQAFDFHSANIVNIIFNNLEQANGIMINITFALNGFRYAEEENINIDEILSSVKYDSDEKQELIGGLYLEYLLDYLYNNKSSINKDSIKSFLNQVIETKTFNSQGGSYDSYESGLLSHHYLLASLFASYSSFPSSYGVHNQNDNKITNIKSLFSTSNNDDVINELANKNIKKVSDKYNYDFFLLDYKPSLNDISNEFISDSDFNNFRDLYKGENYYSLVDNVSLVSLFGNNEYKDYIKEILYSRKPYSVYETYQNILINTIRNCVSELFNSKQNFLNSIALTAIKKIYEEFLFRLFYIVNYNSDKEYVIIEDLKKDNTFFTSDNKINFKKIHSKIDEYIDKIYYLFLKSISDSSFVERIIRESIVESYDPVEKLTIDVDLSIKELSKEINDFKLKLTSAYENNKSIIVNRAYNIFLTKYLYLVSIYISEYTQNINDQINFNQLLKSFVLSSSLHSILLIRTPERTDHFDNSIILGTKNIGYKVSLYNQHLFEIVDEKRTNVMFTNFFNNNQSYYKDLVSTDDFYYSIHNSFDDNVKKDINFFYGELFANTFNNSLHYVKTISNNLKIKNDLKVFFDEERNKFIENKELTYPDYNNSKKPYSSTSLYSDKIKSIPSFAGARLPSTFQEYFFKNEYMNDRMKQRLIAHKDPFKDLENLTDIVYDFNNYVIPDYDIMISKKYQFMDSTSGEEMVGDVYKKINSRSFLMLKNASAVSIVKNPKTKIKVANIILNDVSKSIFNFDPVNGSFDLKTLKNNKIDILHVEVGDEIRVRLGYGKNVQIFNGFIQQISSNSNQLILNCSSFASGLYSETIQSLSVKSGNSEIIFQKFKTVLESLKFSLERISSSTIESIKNSFYFVRPINSFLFKELNDKKKNYNVPFTKKEEGAFYSIFILALQSVSGRVLSNFTPRNILNITSGILSHNSYIKSSLKSIFGSISLPNVSVGFSPDLLVNINNVDADYDTYGLMATAQQLYKEKTEKEKDKKHNKDKEKELDNSILNIDKVSPNDLSKNNEEKFPPTTYGIECYPILLSDNCVITSLYDERRVSKVGEIYFHKGIDFVTNSGRVFSVANGKVINIVDNPYASTGLAIYIEHTIPNSDKTFVSAYFHLISIEVEKNQFCKAGERIGVMGNTGNSSGRHLHFGLFYNSKGSLKNIGYINPFLKQALPFVDSMEKYVDWEQVNVMANNGQYSNYKPFADAYKNSKKTREYSNGGK